MSTTQSPPQLDAPPQIEQDSVQRVEPVSPVPAEVAAPKKSHENHVVGWIKAVAVRCVLYFATYLVIAIISIGPMFWTWYESVYFPDGSIWVNKFYAPLVFLCDRISWLRTLVNWWINWWIL